MLTMSSRLTELSGIGKVRAELFSRLGIETVSDLLYHFPRGYQNRGDIKNISELRHGDTAAVVLTVATVPKNAMIKRGMTLTKFRGFDDTDSIELVFFNQPYLKDTFTVGERYRFYGKVSAGKRNTLMMSSPTYEKYSELTPPPDLFPVYPLCEGLNSRLVRDAVTQALRIAASAVTDPIPEKLRRARGLCSLSFALTNVHKPKDAESLRAAARRLAYDEMFNYALCAAAYTKSDREKRSFYMKDTDIAPFLEKIPFELTDSQKKVVADIRADLGNSDADSYCMSRILVGDVGSGKTVCAAAAMYISVKNGMQAALMAPTEILATQHYQDLSVLFDLLGIRCALLCGSTKKSEKDRIKRQLRSTGEDRIDIVIGTHAVISEDVSFSSLGVVVCDEQHRFGVRQRSALTSKGRGVHTLYMSATPIPRTMSLLLYKELDVSIIDTMPKGRMRVDTFCVNESYRARLNAFIRKQIEEEGGQVYIVCPTVEKSTEDEDERADIDVFDLMYLEEKSPPLKAAVDYARELGEGVFPDIPLGFLHGRMKSAEKDAVMGAFVRSEIKILVSTTVIEVGVNVPSATLMIVENADRFGLSQLHQLRGRVGRGNNRSYCVLVSDSDSETAVKRLSIMKNTYSGFEIAEKDLELRGPGDFFAMSVQNSKIRQSGENIFRMAKSYSDGELMALAFADAKDVWGLNGYTPSEREDAVGAALMAYIVDGTTVN